MSDDLNATLASLRGQQPPRAFDPAEEVRRRGSRRTIRQAVAVVAAVAVIGGATGWLTTYRQSNAHLPLPDIAASQSGDQDVSPTAAPSATTAPSASPTRGGNSTTTPPESLLLQPADLGPGQWQWTGHELLEGSRWYWGNLCPAYGTDADYPSLRNQRSIHTASWADTASRRTSQLVEQYAPGTAAENLAALEALLARCTRTTTWPSGEAPSSYRVEARNFAGDQALLIHIENRVYGAGDALAPEPVHRYVAVVRVGDRIATVIPPANGDPTVQAGNARALAENAAARLR